MSPIRRSSPSFRFGIASLLFAGVGVVAAATPAEANPPLRVHMRGQVEILGGGGLHLRGVFGPQGARIEVEAAELPPPASGAYDIVLSAGDVNLLDVTLAEMTEGDFTALDDVAGDQRLEALSLDAITLYDGDEIVAATSEIETSAHLRFRADLQFESGGRPRRVSVGGLAGRRFDGSGRTILKIVTGVLEPGEYLVRLEGEDDALIEIPFSVDGPRLRRHVTVKEWTDRIDEMSRLETALLFLNGDLVATAPLGSVR